MAIAGATRCAVHRCACSGPCAWSPARNGDSRPSDRPAGGSARQRSYALQPQRRSWRPIAGYAVVACLTALACWPYLWSSPVERFAEVLLHMSDNPKLVPVLFDGSIYASNQLPAAYFPRLLALTLTEPVWPLALAGLLVSGARFVRRRIEWRTWIPVVLWFVVPVAYVVTSARRCTTAFAISCSSCRRSSSHAGWPSTHCGLVCRVPFMQAMIGFVLLLPGLLALVRLHPYPYTYYNEFTGGMRRRLPSLRDRLLAHVLQGSSQIAGGRRPGQHASLRAPSAGDRSRYAGTQRRVESFDPDADQTTPGSLLSSQPGPTVTWPSILMIQ